MIDLVREKGFQKFASKNFSYGIREMYKDFFPSLFLKECKKYMPTLSIENFEKNYQRFFIY